MKICKRCGESNHYENGNCKTCSKNNYLRTKEKQLEEQRRRRKANPAIFKERVKAWVDVNQERMTQLRKRWKSENKEIVCAYSQKRRAVKRDVGGSFSADGVKNLMLLQKCKCAICGVGIKQKYHADHIIPLSGGGDNTIINIQLLCPTCNLQKGAKHPIDFMQQLGFLL